MGAPGWGWGSLVQSVQLVFLVMLVFSSINVTNSLKYLSN